MVTIKRTNTNDEAFKNLVNHLDNDLLQRYAEKQVQFTPHNILDPSARVVIIFNEHTAIGCGAFRPTEEKGVVEVKRMFVLPEFRGNGFSKIILKEIENWAAEENYQNAKLETGNKQTEAIALYKRCGYLPTEPFGPYKNIPESLCFGKELI